MKKTIILSLLGLFAFSSCSEMKQDEQMIKKAKTTVIDFAKGNVDNFIKCLDTTVRSQYPADQIIAVNNVIAMMMGGFEQIEDLVALKKEADNTTANVKADYQNGKILYQVLFDKNANIIGFNLTPVENEVLYTEEEILIEEPETTTPDNNKAQNQGTKATKSMPNKQNTTSNQTKPNNTTTSNKTK